MRRLSSFLALTTVGAIAALGSHTSSPAPSVETVAQSPPTVAPSSRTPTTQRAATPPAARASVDAFDARYVRAPRDEGSRSGHVFWRIVKRPGGAVAVLASA